MVFSRLRDSLGRPPRSIGIRGLPCSGRSADRCRRIDTSRPPAYLSVGRRANTSRHLSPFSEGPMFGALARRLFGSANDRYVKSLGPIVSAINEIEPQLEAMSDDELRARTQRFKEQLADGTELDDLLIEAFATVREGAKRTLGQRHFDVQL